MSLFYLFSIQSSFLYGAVLNYQNIRGDAFDGTVYPIEFIPDPFLVSYEERKGNFVDIDSAKFIKTPLYNPNIFGKNPDDLNPLSSEYKSVVTQRLLYTVPYLGDYEMSYKEYGGSHPWIDIVVPKGTPIKNIANGVVVDVGSQPNGFGNYVLIRHNDMLLDDGTKADIYVLYAHMDVVGVSEWIKIAKGEKIWTVWSSGTATTAHLHFQIDLASAPFHPYWPFTSAQMKTAWVSFFGWVTIGLGKEEAILYTINPLQFVNKNISIGNMPTLVEKTPDTPVAVVPEKPQPQEVVIIPQEPEKQPEKEVVIESPKTEEKPQEVVVNTQVAQEKVLQKEVVLLTTESEFELLDNIEMKQLSQEKETPLSQDILKDELNTELDITNGNTLFSDIPDTYKYFDILKYFKDREIIKWFSDGTFKPKNNLTRIEAFKIMFLSFDKKPQTQQESQFQDVKTQSWENMYVNLWVELGVFSLTNENFYPLRDITKIEALKTIISLSGVQLESYTSQREISDISRDDWQYKYVAYALDNGYVELDKKDAFSPNQALTREDLVVMLYEFLK